MTLKELGEQYAEELKTVEAQTKRAKEDLKNAETEFEKISLYNKIYIYEEMRAELKSYSEHLKHYYEER